MVLYADCQLSIEIESADAGLCGDERRRTPNDTLDLISLHRY